MFDGQDSMPSRARREHLPRQRPSLALGAPWLCTSRVSDQIIIAPRAERFSKPEWSSSDGSRSGSSPSPSDAKTPGPHSEPIRPLFNLFMTGRHGLEVRHARLPSCDELASDKFGYGSTFFQFQTKGKAIWAYYRAFASGLSGRQFRTGTNRERT